MTRTTTPADRHRMTARILRPVARELRLAGGLSVLAGALWPVQAGLLAWAVSGWVEGGDPLIRSGIVAAAFMACALVRAVLEHRAGAILHGAADRTIARERAALIRREARAVSGTGSAAVASLAVQGLPLLHPWITRYQVAMLRVRVLPPLLLALAFWQSWLVGLTLLVAGPLIPVFMALVGMAAEEASRRQMTEIGDMNAMLMERLSALTDIRLLGAMGRASGDFADRAEALRQRTMAVLRVAFLSSTVLEFFSALGVALVAVLVGFTLLEEITIGSWGGLTLGEGLFLLLIAPEFFQPLRELASAWHDRAAGQAVVAELDALDAAPRMAMLGQGRAAPVLPGPLSLRMTGAVADLPGRRVALPEVYVEAGHSLALTGPSGSGKSTALLALAGLVPLAAGAVTVCGQPLDLDTADGWRARLAFVPQRPHVPDVTLAAWLDPRGQGADPAEALRLADAGGIVARLPEGLKTRLGESGGGVSGGEMRRLLLARAVLAGGDLVLADEPTADLDAETAARVIAALERIRAGGRAVVVATHDRALAAAMQRRVALPGEGTA